eukprot:TRINITY_DN593_c0_g1_i1.p1 TRINITY_DN593_c0_g1~~TRINITY_DN593_c0_g1_i1.p1  ORF type:complete len:1206 (+),score=251.43 TRINITY_DN593_c0_g1_i1:533-3619(+)
MAPAQMAAAAGAATVQRLVKLYGLVRTTLTSTAVTSTTSSITGSALSSSTTPVKSAVSNRSSTLLSTEEGTEEAATPPTEETIEDLAVAMTRKLAADYGLLPPSAVSTQNLTAAKSDKIEEKSQAPNAADALATAKSKPIQTRTDAEDSAKYAQLQAELLASREEIKKLRASLLNVTEKEIKKHDATAPDSDGEDADDMMTSLTKGDLAALDSEQVASLLTKLKEEIKQKKSELKEQDKILSSVVHRLSSGKALADYVFGLDSSVIPADGPTKETINRMASTPETAKQAIENTVGIVMHSMKTLTAGKQLADEVLGTDSSKLPVHNAEREVPECAPQDLLTLHDSMNQSCQQAVGGKAFVGNTLAAGDFFTPLEDMCSCIEIALKVSQLSTKTNDCAPVGLPSFRAMCTVFLGKRVFKRAPQEKRRPASSQENVTMQSPQETMRRATAQENESMQSPQVQLNPSREKTHPASTEEKVTSKSSQVKVSTKSTLNTTIVPVKIPNCSLKDLSALFRSMDDTCRRHVGRMIFLSNLEGKIHADKDACLCAESAFESMAPSFPHRDCKPEGLASFKTMCGMELGHAINLDKLFEGGAGGAGGAGSSKVPKIPNCSTRNMEVLFDSMDKQCQGSVGGSLFVSNLIGEMPMGEDFCTCVGRSFLKLGSEFPAHDCAPAGQPSFGTMCALRRHQNKTANSCCAKFFGAPTETGAQADKCPKPFIYRASLTGESSERQHLADCVRFDLSQEECSKEGAYWLPEHCSNAQAVTGPKGVCSPGDLQVLFGAMNATCKAVVGTPADMSSATIVLDEVCPCVGEAMMNLGERGFDCAPAGRESFSRLCSSDGADRIRPTAAKPKSSTVSTTVKAADVPGTPISKHVQLDPAHLEDNLTTEIDKIVDFSISSRLGRAVAKDNFFSKTQLGVGARGSNQMERDRSRHHAEARKSPAQILLLIAVALLGLAIAVLVFRFFVPSRGAEPLIEGEQPSAADAQPPAADAQPPAADAQPPAVEAQPSDAVAEAQAVAAQQPAAAAS